MAPQEIFYGLKPNPGRRANFGTWPPPFFGHHGSAICDGVMVMVRTNKNA
jgi:hypothetical protein